jgi:hypothetical protein
MYTDDFRASFESWAHAMGGNLEGCTWSKRSTANNRFVDRRKGSRRPPATDLLEDADGGRIWTKMVPYARQAPEKAFLIFFWEYSEYTSRGSKTGKGHISTHTRERPSGGAAFGLLSRGRPRSLRKTDTTPTARAPALPHASAHTNPPHFLSRVHGGV